MGSKKAFDKIITDEVRALFKELGRSGGKETAKRGTDYYRELQKKSVKARKKK